MPGLHAAGHPDLQGGGLLTESDADLLRRSAEGDAGAFERFVTRHEASVYRYLRALADDAADAEDALQEAFVAAWRAASSFRGTDARAWLLAIARNRLRRMHRRRAGAPSDSDLVPLERLGAEAGWGAPEDPGAELERREARERVERALGRLSAPDREVLLLRDVEGLTGEEAADVLGISLAALKSRLHRARLRLAAELRREPA